MSGISERAISYVVYAYVDYRKEIGTRILRSYSDRDAAVAFAESLTTKYTNKDADEEDEDEANHDEGRQYSCLAGNVFDARMTAPKEELAKYGTTKEDLQALWYVRIGVDEVEQW